MFLKLLWDFRGPDAEATARHHLIHLKEYIEAHATNALNTGVEQNGSQVYSAFMVVAKDDMPEIRDTLRPHRGKVYEKV